MIKNSAKS